MLLTLGEHEQQYELLVRTHERTIRRLCFEESDGDPLLCAELVQDVFYDLWKSMPLYDPSYTPRQQGSWVRHRCRGVFSHRRRRNKRIKEILVPLREDLLVDVDENNLRETIEELSEGLSPCEKEVLRLTLEGYKSREIAALLGIKANSVNKTYRIIVKKMKCNYHRLYL